MGAQYCSCAALAFTAAGRVVEAFALHSLLLPGCRVSPSCTNLGGLHMHSCFSAGLSWSEQSSDAGLHACRWGTGLLQREGVAYPVAQVGGMLPVS